LSSSMFYQDLASPGLATSFQVYPGAPPPQGDSQQGSQWLNHSGSQAYVDTTPAENPYSPASLGLTYGQASHTPLGSPLDGTSAYPQSTAYSEIPSPNAARQESYSHTSMPRHPDIRGMNPTHRASTFSTQRGVGAPLRVQVPEIIHQPRQDRSNNQANRALDPSHFGGGFSLASPGTQTLTPSPHYQWVQAGAGLPANYPYNVSHHSSPTSMASTASPPGYLSPSHPPSRNMGALSSDRSNDLDQILSSMRYAPTQRATGPTHGFIEKGGYLSAQIVSSPHSAGVASPTQGMMYRDRFGRQAPRDSVTTYQAQGFETQSPNFSWSPYSEYPQNTILTPNSQVIASSNSYVEGTGPWFPESSNF
jgi:hypothetical protein